MSEQRIRVRPGLRQALLDPIVRILADENVAPRDRIAAVRVVLQAERLNAQQPDPAPSAAEEDAALSDDELNRRIEAILEKMLHERPASRPSA